MNDSIQDYFNFTHERPSGQFVHRLGTFKTYGGGGRSTGPKVGVLHVPVADYGTGPDGKEHTDERVALWLATPEAFGGSPLVGTVHSTCDRDSFTTCLPIDSQCYGCANPNTGKDSWEIEISGLGTEPGSYWSGIDGASKLRQAALAHIHAARLFAGDDWKSAIILPVRAQLNYDGSVRMPGWTQHRDVPYWNGSGWAQPPVDNIAAGQHSDICADFPWDFWFTVLNREIALASGAKPGHG